jgi:hypothetical protein
MLISCLPISEYLLERNKDMIERSSVADQGALFKHGGMQSNRSTLYQATVKVEKNTSANPTAKVRQRIEDQKQLRIDLDRESSGESLVLIVGLYAVPNTAYGRTLMTPIR